MIASRAVTVLEQLEDITRDGHALSPDTIEELGRKEAEKARWSTIALWIIALSSVGILIAVTHL